MGLDLDSLFGQAKAAASQGMDDLLKTGGNSALGYLENQAAAVLQHDANQNTANAQAATQAILSRPTNADSFGAYLTNMIQQPAVKQYGPYILGGIAVVLVAGYFIGRG